MASTTNDIPLQVRHAAHSYVGARQSSGSSEGVSMELEDAQGGGSGGSGGGSGGVELERKMGLWSGMAIVVGTIIGSGIFSVPSLVLQEVGSVGMSMVVWGVGAAVSICGCAAYMELGTMLPRSGGEKEYLDAAYPRPRALAPFVFCLAMIAISFPSGLAADAVVTGVYVLYAAVGHAPVHSEWAQRGIGVAVVVACALMHALCARLAIRVQNALTVVKVLLLVLIVGVGLVGAAGGLHEPRAASFSHSFSGTTRSARAYAAALFKVFFAYAGYTSLNYSIDELRSPVRNLPRAAMGGLLLTTALYILSNVAFFVVLSPAAIRDADTAVAGVFFSAALGAAWGQRVVPALIALAAFGNVMCATFSASRVLLEAAREGYVPWAAHLGAISRRFESPLHALAVIAVLAVVFIVAPPPGDSYAFLIDIGGYQSWFFYGLAVVGLLLMRRTHRALVRPFRAWNAANAVTIATAVFMCIVPFVKPSSSAAGDESAIPYWAAPVAALLFIILSVALWYVQVVVRHGLEFSHYALHHHQSPSSEQIK
ncbi:hypothetical protein GGI04_001476 [Coemansia thaxteri]|uniref:Amino acid transporter n=1 Tax=Coemansia thaxteri TaxID=2663907 RepID=A0A9W8BN79_9FUNG|nr:hypothetical protein H4R26_001299 [Coemansia thaxteri]KAJ2007554.1 hypothetical protein GGI04_001476 [Coemansia thaxteri]KAJ2471529.1 hypothetical protein GGI02_002206 [Coemansia sp. RSA 2322]KAJ2485610.1 hypothetical protein EV174_001616 [Coemansia sp. RSA 2320]